MKLLEIKTQQLLRIIVAPLAISLAILIVSAIALKYVTIQSDIFQLVVIFIAVGTSTVGISFALWKLFKLGPFQIITMLK
jgi:hypothetical protein